MTFLDSDRTCTLFISEEAYQQLVDMARALGYIDKDNFTTTHGLHKFVAYVMKLDLVDTRPEDIRETDAPLLEAHQSPEWHIYSPRLRRTLRLTDDTITCAVAHALRLGIAYLPSQRIKGAPTIDEGIPCVSAVLEALGSDWIGTKHHG